MTRLLSLPLALLAAILLASCGTQSPTAAEPTSQSDQLLIDATAARLSAVDFRESAKIAETDEEAALLEAQAQEAEAWAVSLEAQEESTD